MADDALGATDNDTPDETDSAALTADSASSPDTQNREETNRGDEPRTTRITVGLTDEIIEAVIVQGVTTEEAIEVDMKWLPVMSRIIADLREILSDAEFQELVEHDEWRWFNKVKIRDATLFALKCGSDVQGMMCVTIQTSRLSKTPDESLVYIEYVATAPWNISKWLARLGEAPLYGGIGTSLLIAACEYSMQLGYGGRIGLSALPGSIGFYQDACKMTRCGVDKSDPYMPYFEFTEAQAQQFLKE